MDVNATETFWVLLFGSQITYSMAKMIPWYSADFPYALKILDPFLHHLFKSLFVLYSLVWDPIRTEYKIKAENYGRRDVLHEVNFEHGTIRRCFQGCAANF